MRFTTEAINLFTGSLADARKKGGVGSENLSLLLPVGTGRLQVRDRLRQLIGGKLTPERVQDLKKAAFFGGRVTDEEAMWLLEKGLDESNFEVTQQGDIEVLTDAGRAARFDLLRFAVLHLADIDPDAAGSELEAATAANAQAVREYVKGTMRALTSTGEADPGYLSAATMVGKTVHADAAVSDVPVDATAPEMLKVFLEQTDAIEGWTFFTSGATHNVLVKPGINWGINGYPSVSSWESVYAAALGTLERGRAAGANVRVTVADESGIENKAFGRTTMDNMEDVGILGAAVLAGVEQSYRDQGMNGSSAHDAAVAYIADSLRQAAIDVKVGARAADVAPLVRRTHTDLIERAKRAGVSILPLDEQPTRILKPVVKLAGEAAQPGEAIVTREQFDALKHFKDGIRVSTALDDVTDIINLPKPPGRHGIMSNCGLTGAVKNYIGLMSGVDRGESLHSRWARTPPRRDGEDAGNYVDRIKEFTSFLGERGVNREAVRRQSHVGHDATRLGDWKTHENDLLRMAEEWVENMKSEGQRLANEHGQEAEGPGVQWFEKLGELNLMFKHKERFTFTDMRMTVSTFGPDFGEQIPVGMALASDCAAVVDVLASALLKGAYNRTKLHDGGFGGVAEFAELEENDPGIRGLPARLLARVRDTMSSTYKQMQGASFLRGGDAWRLKSHAAVMRYPGLSPADMTGVRLRLAPQSLLQSTLLGKVSLRTESR
jgi:uncharacterized protein (DUF362 family)